jgi:hypothetical protein
MSTKQNGSKAGTPSPERLGSAWLAGWYAAKLHAVIGKEVAGLVGMRSVCGAWVYRTPRTEWAARNMQCGIPRCKHCERILSQNTKGEAPK